MGRLKFYLVKFLVLISCVPAYPFLIIGVWMERNSWTQAKFSEVNADYWMDIYMTLTVKYEKSIFYKKGANK
ncbi:hypothetical protein [Metasolibacillus meyeri]|uniref:hypothetical protein n=1 Tax=Metasolibacillus meyeri TaxID=1071052 RepID=UPI000D300654|nr:hypothetical protein [Metasolibacillus meyeri]